MNVFYNDRDPLKTIAAIVSLIVWIEILLRECLIGTSRRRTRSLKSRG